MDRQFDGIRNYAMEALQREILPRPDDLPENYAWLHSQEIEAAYDRGVLLSDVRQMRLTMWSKSAQTDPPSPWAASLTDGTLTLCGFVFDIQLVGTTDQLCWIFGCESHPSQLPVHIYEQVQELRTNDPELSAIPEFKSDRIGFGGIDGDTFGFRMAMIFARKIPNAFAFYRMPTGAGSSAWAVLTGSHDKNLPVPELLLPTTQPTTASLLNSLRLFILGRAPTSPWLWPTSMENSLLGYLDFYNISYEQSSGDKEGESKFAFEGGKMVLTIDGLGRVTGITHELDQESYDEFNQLLLAEMGKNDLGGSGEREGWKG